MKITHFNNSFILVKNDEASIIFDPWIGKANNGGWQSFPNFVLDELNDQIKKSEWVYISHLHSDHFNPHTLKSLNLLEKTFIIKKYSLPTLKSRLLEIGVIKIVEIEPLSIHNFGPFELSILPQMSSNSSGLVDQIQYDLDTSIVIKSNDVVFFNQVDNPYSVQDISAVNDFINRNFGPIDIACSLTGAASEYPQNFININKNCEKNLIINKSLDSMIEKLHILKPKYFFSAGGTYIIPGKLAFLNKYIAQPDFRTLYAKIISSNIKSIPIDLEGGKFINIEGINKDFKTGTDLQPLAVNKEDAIASHENDHYEEDPTGEVHTEDFQNNLIKARSNWMEGLSNFNLTISQSIVFVIYSKMIIKDDIFDKKYYLNEFILHDPNSDLYGSLRIHIDQNLLYASLINGRVLSGVLCLYEREPNIFYPTDFFSLNFFKLKKDEIPKCFSTCYS
jgi:UDP-MurNAc hydroxylase